MLKKSALALASASLLLAACSEDNSLAGNGGVTFYATDGASLFTFTPNDSLSLDQKAITGINGSSLIYSLDANPRGGSLTALGSDGQVYSINVDTGAATRRGTADSSNALTDKAIEIDYNPVAMNNGSTVFRVTGSTGENYRVNDTTGARIAGPGTASTGGAGVAGNDLRFAYATGDVNNGRSVVVSGIAYTNSQINTAAPAATTVYAIDSLNNTLAVLGGNPGNGAACPNATNPNCGQLTTVGNLGIDIGSFIGFDIFGTNTGYVTALQDGTYNIYTVDLATGRLSFLTAANPKIIPLRSFAVRQQ